MAVKYSIKYANSMIEVRVTGSPDRASLTQMWKDIIAACKEHRCFSILGIADINPPLSLADAIDHQAIFLEAGVTTDHRMAWVQEDADARKRTEVAETVLLNRGLLNGRLFADEFEARRWLSDRL
jgi:hypothetical protein